MGLVFLANFRDKNESNLSYLIKVTCRIPDDHITPSRRGYLMARDVLRDIFGRHAAKAVKLKEPQA